MHLGKAESDRHVFSQITRDLVRGTHEFSREIDVIENQDSMLVWESTTHSPCSFFLVFSLTRSSRLGQLNAL